MEWIASLANAKLAVFDLISGSVAYEAHRLNSRVLRATHPTRIEVGHAIEEVISEW